MTTYTELVTQIRDYTETDSNVLSSTIINDFIEHTENRILRDLDIPIFTSHQYSNFTASSTTVKVHAPSHGFTTSDTVMFWSADNSGDEGSTKQFQGMGVQGTDRFGVAPSELESASGYTPTPDTSNVTPDGPDLKSNFFTITISSTPTATGYGGGGLVFVGPLTVSA